MSLFETQTGLASLMEQDEGEHLWAAGSRGYVPGMKVV